MLRSVVSTVSSLNVLPNCDSRSIIFIAKQHGGKTSLENLALAYYRCNTHKGPNISGIDPITRKLVRLFDPRRDQWPQHFRWQGLRLVGVTAIGRATIRVLCINRSDALLVRAALSEEGIRFDKGDKPQH